VTAWDVLTEQRPSTAEFTDELRNIALQCSAIVGSLHTPAEALAVKHAVDRRAAPGARLGDGDQQHLACRQIEICLSRS
jgi:hypothetical protein